MAFDSYTNLQLEIGDYLARDLTSKIPSFITLAEAKFNRSLRCKDMEQRSTAIVNLAASEPEFISLPSDFQTMRRLRLTSVTGKPRVDYASNAAMDDKRTSRGNATGQPQFFTINGSELELFPTPDDSYSLEMTYRKLIPPLASNSTNWLLASHPDAYLYGALMESEPYTKNDARVVLWAQALSTVIDQINNIQNDAAFNAGPLVPQFTNQVTP